MYFNMENISSVVSKIWKISIFEPFFMVAVVEGRKKIFLGFFSKPYLEMFSILEYIGQIEILAEKNYLGCFRQVRKFKKYT